MYMLPCESKSAVKVHMRFRMRGSELLKKIQNESGKSCSIRLVEFVEKEVSVNGKSLKLRRINFEQLLFEIHNKHAAIDSAQNFAIFLRTWCY